MHTHVSTSCHWWHFSLPAHPHHNVRGAAFLLWPTLPTWSRTCLRLVLHASPTPWVKLAAHFPTPWEKLARSFARPPALGVQLPCCLALHGAVGQPCPAGPCIGIRPTPATSCVKKRESAERRVSRSVYFHSCPSPSDVRPWSSALPQTGRGSLPQTLRRK